MDLFRKANPVYEPLASRMRPRNLSEYIGQDHILGPGRLLRRAIQADQLSSLLFSGPPGTGKTTLAKVIAATTKSSFLSLNAVLSGVKEIRELIEQAQDQRAVRGKKTILFVDEVHRWNKAQQDALLPWVENGTFILIGATTENPYFEVNAALVSRSRIFLLKALNDENLRQIAFQTLNDKERGYGRFQVEFEPEALEHLIKTASGDARSLLNALELAVETSVVPFPPADGTSIFVSCETAEESIQKKAVLYDKDGDYHFDTISAFIKSLRGSDPDAALYWLAKMVRAGEDPQFIFRRMLISASEDVGLADPQALVVVQAAAQAYHHVGMPEGQFHLAQAALYLATCPKSNSTLGYFDALKTLEEEPLGEVPDALKDSSRDKKGFGHGAAYQYPHAFKDHWVAQRYLPSGLKRQIFYQPSRQGYEGRISDEVFKRRESILQLVEETPQDGVLSFSEEKMDPWLKRLKLSQEDSESKFREHLFAELELKRHHLVWIAGDKKGFSVLQALRQTPEGQVFASFQDQKAASRLADYLAFVPELSQPILMCNGLWTFYAEEGLCPDRILADLSSPHLSSDISEMLNSLSPQGLAIFFYPDLMQSQKLSDFIEFPDEKFEKDFLGWEAEYLHGKMMSESELFSEQEREFFSVTQPREVSLQDWQNWWDITRVHGLPSFLCSKSTQMKSFLLEQQKKQAPFSVDWKKTWVIIKKRREL